VGIPLVDVAWQHAQVRAEIDRALDRLLVDVHCDGAEFVAAVETTIARRLGAGTCAVGVQSGLAAEFLILKALGIGPGDEVITVPNSDLATTAAISHAGARFVLVDVDPRTYNLDPARIEAAITPRTRAIVPVHMYGLPAEMDAVAAVAGRYGLAVVEDATLALGASYRGAPVGVLGDAAFLSFAPRKVLGGTGNGGLVTTRNPDLAARVRLLKGYGLDPARGEAPVGQRQTAAGFEHVAEGHNLKLDPLQAAVIGAKLTRLDAWAARRQAIADRYDRHLMGIPDVRLPVVPPHTCHAWRNYVVRVPERDAVRARLAERGIATSVLYVPPVHLQPVYRRLGLGPGSFPNAEAAARELLCLPIHPGLTDAQVDEVVLALTEACASRPGAVRSLPCGPAAGIRRRVEAERKEGEREPTQR
jgi:dTDP-4-amino-4,6-dideoxygalactose transaminase